MKLKKWLSFILLFSFFVLVTPKSIWHDCGLEKHAHFSKNQNHTLKFEKKCFACDYNIDSFDIQSLIFYHFKLKNYVQIVNSYFEYNHCHEFLPFIHRGPPSF